jgi:hypothetical protein
MVITHEPEQLFANAKGPHELMPKSIFYLLVAGDLVGYLLISRNALAALEFRRVARAWRPGSRHRTRQARQQRLRTEFRLWDVEAGQQLSGELHFAASEEWRKVGHVISDRVLERLAGERGHFEY